ncbi:hypothetical protein [Paenibacillus guangzhouensis]|uniref:hypothetical protein n=1 Tax=Paenibacillus guangzhouensis TaxID=1473112 RepID=UPI001D0FBABE|nr:hypothetical protein [Paenibacillus guangzhouensis]
MKRQSQSTATSSSSRKNNYYQLAFVSAILLLISAIIGVYLAYQDLQGNANVTIVA